MAAQNLRQFEFKLGKLGVVLFTIGLAILLFAGFLLGVQVGRHIDTYPEIISRGIPGKVLNRVGLSAPDVRPDIPAGKAGGDPGDPLVAERRTVKAPEGESTAAGPPVPASAREPGFEKKESPADATAEKASPPPPVVPPVSAVAPSTTPQRSPAEAKPAPAAKPVPQPAEPKKEKAATDTKKEVTAPEKNGKYAIQVVSFREKEKADGLSRKIRELGYAPKVSLMDVPGKGQWYRVTVNSFATKQAAEKAADDLTKKIKGVSCVVKSK